MSHVEDQVRTALSMVADEAQAAPLLQRLERPAARSTRPHLVLAAAAAAVALVLVAASVIVLRADERRTLEPTLQPPKILRLSGQESARPGRAAMLVVLAKPGAHDGVHEKPAYVLPVADGSLTGVQESDVDPTWTEHLSLDGTELVRELNAAAGDTSTEDQWLEVVDLRTGAITKVQSKGGFCPALSPDNGVVASLRPIDHSGNRVEVVLIDVSTGRERVVDEAVTACGGLAWRPDGDRLVVRDEAGSRILDRRGRSVGHLPQMYAVNGSMSWSPDGRRILAYDPSAGRFLSHELDSGADQLLQAPRGARKPLGWAGSRIVWLAGGVTDQRLVTTDGSGRHPRLWTRLETGQLPVESVSWSTPLAGAAGD